MFIAHFIWYQGNPPSEYAANIDRFRNLNPQFKIIVWNETTLTPLLEETPSIFKQTIGEKNTLIQKIDIFKYVVLYEYGGVYIDCDVFSEKPMPVDFVAEIDRPTFSNVQLVSYLPIVCINNGIIFSPANHPTLVKIVEDLPKMTEHLPYDFSVLFSTGPLGITFWCWKNSHLIHIVDHVYFEGKAEITVGTPSRGIYLTHKKGNSWMGAPLRSIIYLLKTPIIFLTLVALCCYYIYAKYR
jgi:mannosyltransferase OCH1-like enzyme